jgi:hypothetical protein
LVPVAVPLLKVATHPGPIDFAVIVYLDEDTGEAEVLPVALIRALPADLGRQAAAELSHRVHLGAGGRPGVRVLLRAALAAVDWPLARQVLDYLDIDLPDDEELDQVLPAGDLSIFADLGVDEMELGALSGDLDLFPRPGRARPDSSGMCCVTGG